MVKEFSPREIAQGEARKFFSTVRSGILRYLPNGGALVFTPASAALNHRTAELARR